MTFLAALRHEGIAAPWFLEGPIDGDGFRLYVEKVTPEECASYLGKLRIYYTNLTSSCF
jgi:hypothetical protein